MSTKNIYLPEFLEECPKEDQKGKGRIISTRNLLEHNQSNVDFLSSVNEKVEVENKHVCLVKMA